MERQRFRCKDCLKTFTDTTNTPLYHLYLGDDREELLEEVTNWATYYPSNLDADELVRDMLAH